jgi:hypothetical protein
MRSAFCNGIYQLTAHRICCGHIPAWTTRIGQRWDTYDVAPWNLYNIIWRSQAWVRDGMT